MPFKSFGPLEIGLIIVLVLIIFGVGKLPQIGGAIGKSIREFRKSQREPLDSEKGVAKAEAKPEAKPSTDEAPKA